MALKTSKVVLASLGLAFLAQAAQANEKSGGALSALSASGGIVSPGGPTAVFQNPAGLTYNGAKFALSAQAGASDNFQNPFLRAAGLGGGPQFQLAGGLTQSTSNPSSTALFYGLGIPVGAGFAVGVAGQSGIVRAGGTTINAGVLYSGQLPFCVGATVMGINDGVNEWGLGVSSKLGGLFDVLLDGAYSPAGQDIGIKPGVKVGNTDAALSLSYGFADAANTIQLSDGITVGGSVKVAQATIQLYYNDFSTFYAAATFSF